MFSFVESRIFIPLMALPSPDEAMKKDVGASRIIVQGDWQVLSIKTNGRGDKMAGY